MKRIIVCCDGTWNKPNKTDDGKPIATNVQTIFNFILRQDNKGIPQIKQYVEGVGAEGDTLKKMWDGATGEGIDTNIKDGYRFISGNYESGDELFFFGFSRGAYTARSLAGLIRCCGILKKNDLNLINEAFDIYRDPKHDSPDHPRAQIFRDNNSFPQANIKFIGVWDTVGALGIPLTLFRILNKKKYQFHDTKLSSLVDNAYHAISVDEKRKTFKPTLWTPSDNIGNRTTPQVLEQRWFAGVHSNVGGGYIDTGLSDITLKWMIENAMKCDLAFDDMSIINNELKPDYKGTLYNSRTGIFRLIPPYKREIPVGSDINDTVYERIKNVKDYKPDNVK